MFFCLLNRSAFSLALSLSRSALQFLNRNIVAVAVVSFHHICLLCQNHRQVGYRNGLFVCVVLLLNWVFLTACTD